MIDSLTIDGLMFSVRWSTRRRTIGITVRPSGELVIAAPVGSPVRRIEAAVRPRLPWVRRKLVEIAARPARPPRLFVDGERLFYLGDAYPLALVENGGVAVRLHGGRFFMEPVAVADGRRHMIDWYTAQAEPLLASRVDHFSPAVGAAPVSLRVNDLGRRWGTCDARGRLRFHWEIVLFPRPIVDYIVVHELTHLHELNHSPRFWRRLEQVLPDHRHLKAWLRDHADAHAL